MSSFFPLTFPLLKTNLVVPVTETKEGLNGKGGGGGAAGGWSTCRLSVKIQ